MVEHSRRIGTSEGKAIIIIIIIITICLFDCGCYLSSSSRNRAVAHFEGSIRNPPDFDFVAMLQLVDRT